MPRVGADSLRAAVVAVLAALAALIAHPSAAQPSLLALPAPSREVAPVVVRAAFDLRDINEIDDETESFEFEGVVTLEWRDERQAFDPAVEGAGEKLFQGAFQFNEVFDGWFPQLVLVNSRSYEETGVLLRIRPDGALRLVTTIDAGAKTDLDLRAYPFDVQTLEAEFEVLGFDETEVVLEALPADAATSRESAAEVRMPQWSVLSVGALVRNHSAPHAGETGIASRFVASIEVERKSLFMVRLVILPLLLIVTLSWSVFWMDRSSVGDRVSVSFIGILTAVAYQMVLSETLPQISYLTLMNGFLNVSFVVMCASVVISLWVGALDKRGLMEEGDRIDRRCRWVFPLAYLVWLLVIVAATVIVVG